MSSQLHFHFAENLPNTQRALGFARSRHADQHRSRDGAVFLVHPAEVASLLARLGYPDDVVAAAVLHDVLEDTDAELTDLRARFGPRVAELLRSQAGWGPARTLRFLARHGVSERRQLGQLTDRQRSIMATDLA